MSHTSMLHNSNCGSTWQLWVSMNNYGLMWYIWSSVNRIMGIRNYVVLSLLVIDNKNKTLFCKNISPRPSIFCLCILLVRVYNTNEIRSTVYIHMHTYEDKLPCDWNIVAIHFVFQLCKLSAVNLDWIGGLKIIMPINGLWSIGWWRLNTGTRQ